MKFPAGTDRGIVLNPHDESFTRDLLEFRGACQVETAAGKGFILLNKGEHVAAYFRVGDQVFLGNSALVYVDLPPAADAEILECRLREYDDTEFSLSVQIAKYEHLICNVPDPETPPPMKNQQLPEKKTPALLDEHMLQKIIHLPGVLAVSAFFEGFPVQSMGDADFEHVAVSAEDFLRAGIKIAQEIGIGNPDQLILETATHKFIIAPCGDLYLCIFTNADAQLGLIRIMLKTILSDISR